MKFLLFCFARTGSTSLMRALACHSAARWVNEPFNPSIHGEKWRAGVCDVPTLHAALGVLTRRYDGIKHVWHQSGWPFGRDPELNRELIANGGDRTLLLNRRNILKRIVSSQISEQTRIWHAISDDDRRRLAEFCFKPLDHVWIAEQIASERAAIELCRVTLEGTGRPWRAIWYEDLFEGEPAAVALDEIFAFLGLSPLEDSARAQAIALMDPRHKLNTEDRYLAIPGIEEVERRFGSDDTGWLLR